jgi:hypothetical protein
LPRSSCYSEEDSAALRRRRNPASLPPLPCSEAEARALDWDQLKALVVDYPEIEYLVSRWVGLTQPERDSFRAALDAADAIRASRAQQEPEVNASSAVAGPFHELMLRGAAL